MMILFSFSFLVAISALASSSPDVLVDDFADPARYNSLHQNALGLFSDDGGTFSSDYVSSSPGGGGGSLSLQAHAGQYWYSVLGDCLDASGYTHLQLAVRSHSVPTAAFNIELFDKDPSNQCGGGNAGRRKRSVRLSDYADLTGGGWTTVSVPLSDFAALEPSRLLSLGLADISPGTELEVDEIKFVNADSGSSLLVDDFSYVSQYNAQHQNDLAGYTDDDGVLAEDAVLAPGALTLRTVPAPIWRTDLSGDCLDASGRTHLRLTLRTNSVKTFDFNVVIFDKDASYCEGGGGGGSEEEHSVPFSSFGGVTEDWRDFDIPLSAFGADQARLSSLELSGFPYGSSLEIQSIRLVHKQESSSLIIDDFSSAAQYNAQHLNDLGGWTDDDGSLGSDSVSASEAITLDSAGATGAYWYTVLGNCYDASTYTHLVMRVRNAGSTPSVSFDVNLQDKSDCSAAAKTNHVIPSVSISGPSWRDIRIPFSSFGADPSRLFAIVLSGFSPSARLEVDSIELRTFEKGVSAWVYESNTNWLSQLESFDSLAPSDRRLRYLFPYAGEVVIGPASASPPSFDVHYSAGAGSHTDFYRSGFDPSTSPGMYPNIDGIGGDVFRHWSLEDMEWAAQKVADAVMPDSEIEGVHMNIEPYFQEHLPFYSRLRSLLNAGGKRLAVFSGATDSRPLLEASDVLVLSGYDRGVFASPWSPQQFAESLDQGVRQILDIADTVPGSHVMVGIPVLCSTTEFESAVCSDGTNVTTGYTQEQYASAAAEVLSKYHCRPSYLGSALWGFTDRTTWGHGTTCTFHRRDVSTETWTAIETYETLNC